MQTKIARRLNRTEARSLGGMVLAVAILHVVGWGLLVYTVGQGFEIGKAGAFGIGLGVTAYALGMRHAFDIDHIAAVDNVTRSLLADHPENGRPLTVGFWFAIGHSSVVVGLCLLLAFGVRALGGQVADGSSVLQQSTSIIGTSISSLFLLAIGLVNAVVLIGIIRIIGGMRAGHFHEADLENHLQNRGLLNRVLGRFTRAVKKPRHMYPVGLLFGLGFDTATEVSLLVLAGGAAAFDLPWYALLSLPILFTAGMCLFDSLDGAFMGLAYDWALLRPARKVYYNLTVTGLSVTVALTIGCIQLIGLFETETGTAFGPFVWLSSLDLSQVGYGIFALFVTVWAISIAVWHFGRIDEKWSPSRPTP